MNLFIFTGSLILSVVLCLFYKKLWALSYLNKKTPTGFGITLIFLLIIYAHYMQLPSVNLLIFLTILSFSIIYWIDDIRYLSSVIRFCIQFICGGLIGYFLLTYYNYNFSFNFYLLIILSGLLNLFLTNVINFYDGLDLNIVTLILNISLIFLYLEFVMKVENYYWALLGGYIIGFAVFNYFPNSIFFGDSGCYVLSSFMCFFIVQSFVTQSYTQLIIIVPLLIPILDVIYVICLRIYLKESLLSRNYHHIYHKIESKFKNKLYLLPQIINIMIIFLVSELFIINLSNLWGVVFFLIMSIVISIINYFFLRLYLSKQINN